MGAGAVGRSGSEWQGVFEEEEEEEEGAPPTNVTGYNVSWGKKAGPNGTQLLLPLLASGR